MSEKVKKKQPKNNKLFPVWCNFFPKSHDII